MGKETLQFLRGNNQVIALSFLSQCFLKEIENIFSMFLSSYKNTGKRNHSPAVRFPFLVLSNYRSYLLDRKMFSVSLMRTSNLLLFHVTKNTVYYTDKANY